MNKKLFDQLVKSVNEAAAILKQMEEDKNGGLEPDEITICEVKEGTLKEEIYRGKSYHYFMPKGTRGWLAISRKKYRMLYK